MKLRRLSMLLLIFSFGCAQEEYKKGELLFEDDFEDDLSHWVTETKVSPYANAQIKNGKMLIDVNRGVTVWLNKKLSGNISIEYDRKVIMEDGNNDRLSDLNQFWMAQDPKNQNLFTREGNFNEYDSLQLYYFGIGGNTNSTTRFRKYLGNGERFLIHDFRDEKYMLQPNKTYHIQTIVHDGVTKVFVDGKEYFSYEDEDPYTEGYFGIRTTESRHEIDDVKVYSLK